jgi:hypothetical protein
VVEGVTAGGVLEGKPRSPNDETPRPSRYMPTLWFFAMAAFE